MAVDIPLPDDSRPIRPTDNPPVAPDTTTPDDSGLLSPSVITSRLDTAEEDILNASEEVLRMMSGVADDVEHKLYAADMDVTAAVADLVGSVDGKLTGAWSPIGKLLDTTQTNVDKLLTQAGYDLYASDIQWPGDPLRQQQIIDLPPDQMLTALLPDLSATVATEGVVAQDPTVGYPPGPAGPGCADPAQVAISQGSTYLGVPADPVTGLCPYGGTPILEYGRDINDPTGCLKWGAWCPAPSDPVPSPPTAPPPPDLPPEPPPPPPPVPFPVPTDPAAPGVCCPPTTITVTSPPAPTPTFILPPPPPPPPRPPVGRDTPLPPISVSAECQNWDVQDVCEVTRGIAGSESSPGETGEAGAAKEAASWLSKWIAPAGEALTVEFPGFAAVKIGSAILAGHGSLAEFGVKHDIATTLSEQLIDKLTGKCVENKAAVTGYATMLAGVAWAESITGAPLKYLAQSNQYALQFLDPQFLPGQADVDVLYLRSYIDSETWTCLTKANGNLPNWHSVARDAKQALLSPGELIQLWRRKLLTDSQLNNELGRHGFISPGYKEGAKALSEMPLTPSDLTTGMVRDVFDEDVVTKYDYDKDFDKKFNGKAQEWAYWQGLSKEQFRYIWRMHWKFPSDGQFFQMLHRLREDRPEVAEWTRAANAKGEDDSLPDPGNKPPVVTQDDVREALEINDVAPAWVDALIAISYHPITMTDATRAYMIGYFDDDQLKGAFLDNGYNDADAQTLTEYWQFETNKRIRSQSGVLTPRRVLSLYKIGAFSRNDARSLLEDVFPNADQLDKLLDLADKQQTAEDKEVRAKALKRSFLTGEMDAREAEINLAQVGIDRAAGVRLVGQWEAERTNRSKETTALMLCRWAWHGLIGPNEHRDRLMRLGYPREDANRIATVCEKDNNVKRLKQAKKDAKEALGQQRTDLLAQIKKLREMKEELEKWFADHPSDVAQPGFPGGPHE